MKRSIVIGLICALSAVVACDEKPAASAPMAAPAAAAAPKAAPTPSPAAAAAPAAAPAAAADAAGSVGVKECDDYVAMWNNCYKDPAMRSAAQPGLDAMKKSWATMAANPATKGAMAQGCKMALDNFPKASCR